MYFVEYCDVKNCNEIDTKNITVIIRGNFKKTSVNIQRDSIQRVK